MIIRYSLDVKEVISKMGVKLLWTGLLLFLALPLVIHQPVQYAGAILMLIGAILMWLDK